MNKLIVNAETGEEIIAPLTDEDVKVIKDIEAEQKAKEEKELARATARQALLDKLGITAEEAKLLLGGN